MTRHKATGRTAIVVPAIVLLFFGVTFLSAAAIALGLTLSPVTVPNSQPPIFPNPSAASHAKGGASATGPVFGTTGSTPAPSSSGHHHHRPSPTGKQTTTTTTTFQGT